MAAPYLLGIDIGTSGAKAALIDAQGGLVGVQAREYPILTPRRGWAEQDPQAWLAAVSACVCGVLDETGARAAEIAGIGLAGQMHSLVCLDRAGQPLRLAILWADQRSAAQVRRLSAEIGVEALARWTGNPLAAGFMLASWVWLLENEPQTAAETRMLLLPKDYVRYRMTGALGSEPSDASSTLLFDPHLKTWSAPLLEHIGLSVERLPPVFASHQIAGGLTAEMAAACGLLAGTPVVFGGSDVSLQALAQGTIAPGTVSVTIGTGGQIFAPLTSALHDPLLRLHLFCHAVPDTWHHEAAVLSAGLALRWLRDGLWPDESYAGLADAAAGVQAGLDGLFFLPFLSGERTPYMDAGLPASFLGLGLRHGRAHLTRAVMEGVVFALRQGLDLMQSLGTPMERLVLTGGATRHPLWLQLQADIFQRPVLISETQEATARGAALLAGVGVGLYADCAAAVRAAVRAPLPGALPDPQRAQAYGQAYQQYVALASMLVGQYGGKSSI